jgi:hypothetical protein
MLAHIEQHMITGSELVLCNVQLPTGSSVTHASLHQRTQHKHGHTTAAAVAVATVHGHSLHND